MDLDEVNIVYTCGLCETIVEACENHPCIEGYSNVWIDNDTHYFYPVTEDNKIVRRSQLEDGTEAEVEDVYPLENEKENTSSKKKSSKTSKKRVPLQLANGTVKMDDIQIELLILEVQNRPPLWNFFLPITERSRQIVTRLWEEVSNALKGVISADDAKKKFKTLRDMHRKMILAEQQPSGSGRPAEKPQWKFYRQMEFMRDTCLKRPTNSNVPPPMNKEPDQEELETSLHLNTSGDEGDNEDGRQDPDVQPIKKARRRSSKDDENLTVLNRIADALIRPAPTPTPPPLARVDDVEGFLVAVGTQLRRLPDLERMEAMIAILNLVMRECRKFASDGL